jgi:DNA-binding beta-propeller fold protein YncE
MKRILQFITVAAALAASTTLLAQSVPEIKYNANADLLSLPAYGEVAGVATDSRGHIFVYARTGNPYAELGGERTFYHGGARLFEFSSNGTYLREIGQGAYAMNYAQQVRVDPEDNIWIVDAGSNMLMKFNPDGQFLLALGRKPEAINVRPGPGVPARSIDPEREATTGGGGGGQSGLPPGAGIPGNSFDRPSDVTWDSAGNIYVADGFGANNRVAKFNPDGNFVKSWGQTGSAQGQFNNVRGIATDAADNIYVADAGNNRIQVFDTEGNFKSEITGIGSPQAICISSGPAQYLYSSNSNDAESMDNGEIYKVTLDGRVVGKFGQAGKMERDFGMVNAIDCRTENNLIVGEVWNWRAQSVMLQP